MTSLSDVTDDEAAIQCLMVMYQKRLWPHSPTTLNTFIQYQAKSSSTLAFWLGHRTHQKISQIRKGLLTPLIRMGAVKQVTSTLTWNHQVVEKILLQSCQPGSVVSQGNQVATKPRVLEVPKPASDSIRVVETKFQLEILKDMAPFKALEGLVSSSQPQVVAVDCKGVPEDLFLVQVGTRSTVYVFDCIKLGAEAVCAFLSGMMGDKGVVKLFHDLHKHVAAFARIGGIDCFRGTLDTQLAMEYLTGNMYFGFNQLIQELGQVGTKKVMKDQMNGDRIIFAQRPLPRDLLQYAVDDIRLLRGAHDSLCKRLGSAWSVVQQASDRRANMTAINGGGRCICFDAQNSYAVASHELLLEMRPDDMMSPTPLVVSNDIETLRYWQFYQRIYLSR